MRNFFDLVEQAACRTPDAEALVAGDARLTYRALAALGLAFAERLQALEIAQGERLAIFLDKRIETVVAMLGAAAAGVVFVPINPALKPEQVHHILVDSGARCLVTSSLRARILGDGVLAGMPYVILTDAKTLAPAPASRTTFLRWMQPDAPPESVANRHASAAPEPRADTIDADLAALLYTSGSTGRPKGVMLSHRNLLEGAWSVAQYLRHTAQDRILAALPLSFDAGLSQLTTAWAAGASAVLVNYLMPADVVEICVRERITGFAGVPPLWIQLARAAWPGEARARLRYFANTGGHLPRPVLHALRELFPSASPYLMYGLTEAFRSTYLDPAEVDRRPDSIGKAVPNARILVVREDGAPCAPNEVGELVHVGACVTLGYWNDPARTALRYRPSPEAKPGGAPRETAVWSGDLVRRDDDGFLYFVARNDAQIKSSGYRISPEEIEEVAHASGLVAEAVALGVPHDELGESITLVVVPLDADTFRPDALRARDAHSNFPRTWCRIRSPRARRCRAIRTGNSIASRCAPTRRTSSKRSEDAPDRRARRSSTRDVRRPPPLPTPYPAPRAARRCERARWGTAAAGAAARAASGRAAAGAGSRSATNIFARRFSTKNKNLPHI
ncbi:AMP-binding enzyme family protein [Burkholderia pseudomallei]|nr:AMP-binding enzyme family protein [Burkholderia pseudomallei]